MLRSFLSVCDGEYTETFVAEASNVGSLPHVVGADRLKGKFRSFLLAFFRNHVSDAVDRARRLRLD
jgi:hypothetical protein